MSQSGGKSVSPRVESHVAISHLGAGELVSCHQPNSLSHRTRMARAMVRANPEHMHIERTPLPERSPGDVTACGTDPGFLQLSQETPPRQGS